MKYIIRIILSGVLATFFTTLTQMTGIIGEFPDQFRQLPTTAFNFLELLYDKQEFILFVIWFGISFVLFSRKMGENLFQKLENFLKRYTSQEILIYIVGLSIGLVVANLVSNVGIYEKLATISFVWNVLLYLGLGCFGIYLVHLKKEEIKGWFNKKGIMSGQAIPKLLDTSAIIDGRILDVLKKGWIEGKLIIPQFILDELRHIADSTESVKRAKGRRGLDILNEIRSLENIVVEICEIDDPQISEVDSKLVKLAEQLQAMIITNDLNLSKVAHFKNIMTLNINDLSNALKMMVMPHEEMQVLIVKEGKEQEQGIGYLNDGTMVVVEQGRSYVGQVKMVQITSVLQTSAGRMVFAKII